jgi:hypothetical protein
VHVHGSKCLAHDGGVCLFISAVGILISSI